MPLRMHTTLKGASGIMSIVRNRNGHLYFLHFLLICASPIVSPKPAFAQTTDSSEPTSSGGAVGFRYVTTARSGLGPSATANHAIRNLRRSAPRTMPQRHWPRSGWHLGQSIAYSAERCHLACAVRSRHRSCAPLRRTSTAESWDRQEQDRRE